MAETLGLNGVVRLSDTGTTLSATHNMLNVTAFSIEETSETIDTTSMGDASREIVATFKGFSVTVDGYWYIDDAAIGHDDSPTAPVVTAGDKIDFEVYPGGLAVANLAVYKGSAIVTSISRSQSFDGVTEYSMTFEGTGDLSYDKTPTP